VTGAELGQVDWNLKREGIEKVSFTRRTIGKSDGTQMTFPEQPCAYLYLHASKVLAASKECGYNLKPEELPKICKEWIASCVKSTNK